MRVPDTRHSLIERICDNADAAAWVEFCAVYEPAIYAAARRYGLQDADAREVSQEVLLTVSRKIRMFDPKLSGRFRSWLAKIARHTAIDLLRRQRERGTGRSDIQRLLNSQPDSTVSEEDLLTVETRRQKFRWAADQVRHTVNSKTWQAFWMTAVEGLAGEQVAVHLEMSVGAVYVARCRTLARIKSLITSFGEEE